jgi:hypothetical protein
MREARVQLNVTARTSQSGQLTAFLKKGGVTNWQSHFSLCIL